MVILPTIYPSLDVSSRFVCEMIGEIAKLSSRLVKFLNEALKEKKQIDNT